jgi:3-(methylthio)propanoyl-CoA dehydrogenase
LVAQELGTESDFVEFMTPICKYFCTEAGISAADLAIQVMGGYGYLREYGAEQNWRDARICAIYEGTNGIHARTNATRSISFNGGAGARAFSDFVRDSGGDLTGELANWDLEMQKMAEMPDASLGAHAFMERTCALAYRAAWARISAVADASSDASRLLRLKECEMRR